MLSNMTRANFRVGLVEVEQRALGYARIMLRCCPRFECATGQGRYRSSRRGAILGALQGYLFSHSICPSSFRRV